VQRRRAGTDRSVCNRRRNRHLEILAAEGDCVIRTLGLSALVVLLSSCATVARAQGPQIAITIDDLPVHAPYPPGLTPLQVNRQMIDALKAAHVPVTAFVNAVNVNDADTMEALREWRAGGLALGNHTWSHPHLSELTGA